MNAPFKPRPVKTSIIEEVLATATVGISDLKKNPSAVVAEAQRRQVAIMNRNRPVAYLISPEVWDHVVDVFDDMKLARDVEQALANPGEMIEVSIDDLV